MKIKLELEIEFETMEPEDIGTSDLDKANRIREAIGEDLESKYYKEDLNIDIKDYKVIIL